MLEGLETVRASGLTNRLARHVVAGLAADLGYGAAAEWTRKNPSSYARGVLLGFAGPEDRPARM